MLMQDAFDRYNLNGYFRALLGTPVGHVDSSSIDVLTAFGIGFIPFYDEMVEIVPPPLNFGVYDSFNNSGMVQGWLQNTALYLKWFQEFFGVYKK